MGYDWGDFERDTKDFIPWKEIWRSIRTAIDAYAMENGIPLPKLREKARKYLQENPGADAQEVMRYVQENPESGGVSSSSFDMSSLAVPVMAGLVLWFLIKRK